MHVTMPWAGPKRIVYGGRAGRREGGREGRRERGREGGRAGRGTVGCGKPELYYNIVEVVGNKPYMYHATSLDVGACGCFM